MIVSLPEKACRNHLQYQHHCITIHIITATIMAAMFTIANWGEFL
jgi:hypothetical protein